MTKHITVLGAGITGLSSAFHLSRLHPTVKITLIERQRRPGGWFRSTRVPLPGKYGSALIEEGPRAFRMYDSLLEMTNILGLQDKIVKVPGNAPGAMPPSLVTPKKGLKPMVVSSLTVPLVGGVIRDILKPGNKPKGVEDETMYSFFARRFGTGFAQLFGTSVMHGIFCGDARKMSIRATFPPLWDAAQRGWGGIARGFLFPAKSPPPDKYDVGNLPKLMKGVAYWQFKEGTQTLTDALAAHLQKQKNVEIMYGTPVKKIEENLKVQLENGTSVPASHIVSALPTNVLHNLLPKDEKLAALAATKYGSVHIVNLIFPGPPSSIHPNGFGYFVPGPEGEYPAPSATMEVPILGTTYMTGLLGAQDHDGVDAYRNAKFTKLTVSIGGPYGLPPLPEHLDSTAAGATTPAYIENLLKQLSSHFKRELPAPIFWKIKQNDECLPTLTPGHVERVETMKKYLNEKYDGKFQVAGAGVSGVSTGDCAEQGRQAAKALNV